MLQRHGMFVVKSALNTTSTNGLSINILYYSLITPIVRNRTFPLYAAPRSFLNKSHGYTSKFKTFVSKV